MSGSGICWAICKSAPHPRQIAILCHEGGNAALSKLLWDYLLAISHLSGCTVASSVVVGVCNCCQMRTSKCTCLIFGVSIGLDS